MMIRKYNIKVSIEVVRLEKFNKNIIIHFNTEEYLWKF